MRQSRDTAAAGVDSRTEAIPAPNRTTQEGYLSYDGEPSGIYLVNSSATFGTFDSVKFNIYGFGQGDHGALPGDPYLYISGTIRNDDNKTLWVPLLANVYDTKGNQIGSTVSTNGRSEFLASYLSVSPNETGDFNITVKYDRSHERKDIAGYEIYLAWEPTENPPP